MHDLLLDHQDALQPADLVRYAEQLGLDVARFTDHLRERAAAPRIADDVEGADLSGVTGTPTFFVNGRRHYGAYDIATLSAAVRAAGARAKLASENDRQRVKRRPGRSGRAVGDDVDERAARLPKHEAPDSPLLVTERIGDLEALLHGPGVDGIDVGHPYRDTRRAGRRC